jgi:hypothetical protein
LLWVIELIKEAHIAIAYALIRAFGKSTERRPLVKNELRRRGWGGREVRIELHRDALLCAATFDINWKHVIGTFQR